MPQNLGKILLIVLGLSLLTTTAVWAAFGFSPGAVKNEHLFPGSHFEQAITFSRDTPEGDLRMEVTIDAPEIKDWLSIDRGLSFIFPDGKQQIPMIVSVDVPKDAAYGKYKGFIRVKAIPTGERREGAVAVIVGGDVRIDLTVTEEEFSDFRVRTFDVTGIAGKSVKVSVNLENLGNVPVAPSKVHLKVYDEYFNLLYSGEASNLEKVAAFMVGTTLAEFPFPLEKGYYWGEVEIYKGEEVVQSGKKYFGVAEKKPVFAELVETTAGKVKLIGGIIILLGVIIGLAVWFKKRKKKIEKVE